MTELEIINIIRGGGPSAMAAAALVFVYRVIWPYMRDVHLPALAAARTKTAAAMEDIASLVKTLNVNITSLNSKVDQVCQELGDVQQDVAGLYGQLGKSRPSRSQPVLPQKPQETVSNG